MTRRDALLDAAEDADMAAVDQRALAAQTDMLQTHLTDLRRYSR